MTDPRSTLKGQIGGLAKVATAQRTVRAKSDVVTFSKTVGLVPEEWQARVMRSQSKRILLNCYRQSGKSTTAAIRTLHRAIFMPRSLTLIISPTERQSFELLRKVQDFAGKLESVISPPIEKNNASELEFANGSRVVSLPGKNEETIRGYSAASEIIIDEAGDVTDDIFTALIPMLDRSKGNLIVAGTPKGQRGKFWQWWTNGDPEYDRTEVSWRESKHLTPHDIERHRIEFGEAFAQEYECQFLRLSGGVVYPAFSANDNVIAKLPEPDPQRPWTYLLSIDFGYVDATAFCVLGWRQYDRVLYVIHSYQKSGMLVDDIAAYAKGLHARWPYRTIVGDVGGYGKGPAMELGARYGLHIEPAPKTEKVGYISLLNASFARKQVLIVGADNVELIGDIERLPWNGTRTDTMPGYSDHLPDSLLYGHRVATAYLEADEPAKIETDDDRIRAEMREYWQRATEKKEAADAVLGTYSASDPVGDWLDQMGGE